MHLPDLSSVDVLGVPMAFRDVGSGPPVVFLHGNPTSSHLWRLVLPEVAAAGWRCIALDLVGMGASGRPDIEYRLTDHIHFVEAFLDALGLDRCVLVGHDWGAVIALDQLRRNPYRTHGVCFLEGHIHPVEGWEDWDDASRSLFSRLRAPGEGERLVLNENFFVEQVLPAGILRTLGSDEFEGYRAPFPDPLSRRPILQWVRQIPIAGTPADVREIVLANQEAIRDPARPKLMLHATPGAVIGPAEVEWCRAHGGNLTIADVGAGVHFLPEDQPGSIARNLCLWLDALPR